MITLDTLTKATAQEVFDQAANHLLTQNQKSVNPTIKQLDDLKYSIGCQYRAGSLKCAAGCFISDEEYNLDMEGKGWGVLTDRGIVPSEHCYLISQLQAVHDGVPVEGWGLKLKEVAELNKLTFNHK